MNVHLVPLDNFLFFLKPEEQSLRSMYFEWWVEPSGEQNSHVLVSTLTENNP